MTKARRLGLGLLVSGVLACVACDSPEKAAPTSAPTQAAASASAPKAETSAAPAGGGGANQTGSSTTATGAVEAP